jgi:TRAP-type C4-dicarboxylate transport system permease small subunit
MRIFNWNNALKNSDLKFVQIITINDINMETNYLILALVLIGAAFLLILLIWKNRKDQKEFEQKMNQESIDPEHHKEEKI